VGRENKQKDTEGEIKNEREMKVKRERGRREGGRESGRGGERERESE